MFSISRDIRLPKLIGQEVNIGMNEEISIEQLAYKIARILGKRI